MTMKVSEDEFLEQGAALTEWWLVASRLATELKIAKSILMLEPNSARDIFIAEVDRVLEWHEKLEKARAAGRMP